MQNGLKISIPYKKLCYTVKQELFNINKDNLKTYKQQV